MNKRVFKFLLYLSILFGAISTWIIFLGDSQFSAGHFVVLGLFCLALGGRIVPILNQMSFSIWVILAVSIGFFYPQYFQKIGDFQITGFIVPLIQLIMFTMGTEMSLKDFEGVIKTPKAVLIGLLSHFTIMPLVGVTLARSFGFPPEIAAGVILMGSVPSGVTSNVLAFIAKANMPLSVTIAAISTLAAPFMTPLLMKLLAGQYVEIDIQDMMIHVAEIIILPIVLGLIVNKFLHNKVRWIQILLPKISMWGVLMMMIVIVSSGRDSILQIGPLLFLSSMIHHTVGYLLGYWSGRAVGLDEASSRTISLEVGMQNGGLASGIALQMGKIATVGLASVIAVPWMTISGSMLANWWKNKETVSLIAPDKNDNSKL